MILFERSEFKSDRKREAYRWQERHCEERSDEAISALRLPAAFGFAVTREIRHRILNSVSRLTLTTEIRSATQYGVAEDE